jgi:hypothetical protein
MSGNPVPPAEDDVSACVAGQAAQGSQDTRPSDSGRPGRAQRRPLAETVAPDWTTTVWGGGATFDAWLERIVATTADPALRAEATRFLAERQRKART